MQALQQLPALQGAWAARCGVRVVLPSDPQAPITHVSVRRPVSAERQDGTAVLNSSRRSRAGSERSGSNDCEPPDRDSRRRERRWGSAAICRCRGVGSLSCHRGLGEVQGSTVVRTGWRSGRLQFQGRRLRCLGARGEARPSFPQPEHFLTAPEWCHPMPITPNRAAALPRKRPLNLTCGGRPASTLPRSVR